MNVKQAFVIAFLVLSFVISLLTLIDITIYKSKQNEYITSRPVLSIDIVEPDVIGTRFVTNTTESTSTEVEEK